MSNIDSYVRTVANDQLATALEYIGSGMKGGISDAILKEAAKRLREQPEPHLVEPRKPDPPPLLTAYAELQMSADDWRAEDQLPNGGIRCRHIPTRCVFEIWMQGREIRIVLRQGAAGTELFAAAKEWFADFGEKQTQLL